MALFGNLRDLPLPELLSLLARREGYLDLILPQSRLSLGLAGGRLQEVLEGGRRLDPLEARARMVELMNAREGAFEFHPGPVPRGLDWPVERLLMATITLVDELSAYHEALPDPRTRFRLKPGMDPLLDEPLFSFWQRAKPLLERGINAQILAQSLHLPLDQVRYYLHKLRLLGLVEVVRALEEGVREERPGLWQRLLLGVQRLLGGGA